MEFFKEIMIKIQEILKQVQKALHRFYLQKDKFWLAVWAGFVLLVWLWNLLFLNAPALRKVEAGFFNTFIIVILVVIFSLLLSLTAVNGLLYLQTLANKSAYWTLTFFLNLIRSIPQIVGILFSYVGITILVTGGVLQSKFIVVLLSAAAISIFVFIELMDLMRDRISYFKKLDFFNSMLVCGIHEMRIINFNILWKNSRIHILNKIIALAGIAVFLQCSVDFIISVGLNTEINAVNLPVSLGSMLAHIDSKQDILAVGFSMVNPSYIPELFFKHLQGLTTASLIVFSLLSVFKISSGFAKRHRL